MFRAFCFEGQALAEAIEATREFGAMLVTLPRRPGEALRMAAHGSPLVLAEALALTSATACWLWYLLTRNCSHVDRMWSILPPIYVAILARDELAAVAAVVRQALSLGFATGGGAALLPRLAHSVAASGADVRLLAACVLTAAWGCRLTYNFWRKGGYRLRFEDHRWEEVRKLMSPPLFELFNLVFVAAAQHLLCLLITLPAFVAASTARQARAAGAAPAPMGTAGWAAVAVFAALLLGEAVADQQQWAFQCHKRALLEAGQPRQGDYRRGFRTTGLFRFSRHPSFFCEYGMWWSLYVLCAALPSRCALGWASSGAVGLMLLFHCGSLWITERISAAKYPTYSAYQAATSALLPWLPGPKLADQDD